MKFGNKHLDYYWGTEKERTDCDWTNTEKDGGIDWVFRQ